MGKCLGVLIGGIFVGAVGMEILRRQCPAAIDKFYKKTKEVTSGVQEAFKAGYEKVTRPEEVIPEPGA